MQTTSAPTQNTHLKLQVMMVLNPPSMWPIILNTLTSLLFWKTIYCPLLSSTNLQLPMLTYTTIPHTVCQLVMPFLTHSFFASEDCVLQKITSTQNPNKWLSSSFDAITLWMWSCKQSPGPKMFPGPLHCYHLRRVWIHLAPGLSWPTIHTICLSNVSFWTNGHLSNRMTKPKWYSLSLHQLPTDGQSTYVTVWSDPVSPATGLSLPNHRQVHSLVNCKACPWIDNNTEILGPRGRYTVRRSFSCQMTNLIYVVRCLKCADTTHILYVGETGRTFESRISDHESDIRLDRTSPLGRHFNDGEHSRLDFRVQIVWKVQHNSQVDRKILESRFIAKLGTLIPAGLNLKP